MCYPSAKPTDKLTLIKGLGQGPLLDVPIWKIPEFVMKDEYGNRIVFYDLLIPVIEARKYAFDMLIPLTMLNRSKFSFDYVKSASYGYFTIEAEKDNYPQIFLSVLHFDGVEFELIGQDDVGGSFRSSGSFKYLKKFEGDLPSGAVYKRYTEYVLVDDDTLTHEEIMKSFYSSNIRDNVRSRTVYSDYHD